MSGDRLPHACYRMLNGLDNCNRVTWASNIKMLLCKVGFEYVWNAQGVQDENVFLCVFENRVKQHFVTLWRNEVLNPRKLSTYSMFKTEFVLEPYLDILKIKKHREIFCRLRCSNHSLVIETGRHTGKFLEIAERVCPLCVRDGLFIIEDEFHFVFCCPSY